MKLPPILAHKDPGTPSVFAPAALMREARRQKGLPSVDVPPVCILDPDGDIVRRLQEEGHAESFRAWACYHTDLHTFALGTETVASWDRLWGRPLPFWSRNS